MHRIIPDSFELAFGRDDDDVDGLGDQSVEIDGVGPLGEARQHDFEVASDGMLDPSVALAEPGSEAPRMLDEEDDNAR